MPLTLTRTSEPDKEPLTVVEAKQHLRVDHNDDDGQISALVRVAREHVENVTRRALITQTWKLYLDDFPLSKLVDIPWSEYLSIRERAILVPRSPLQSITSIEYVDTDGTTQTLASSKYRVDTDSEPARLTEEEGETWPTTDHVTNGVIITFDAGYGDDRAAVPEAIKQAMKLHVELHYDRPDPQYSNQIRASRDSLLSSYRVFL